MNADKKVKSAVARRDPNLMILQMFQEMQEQMAHGREKCEAQTQLLASQMTSQMEAKSTVMAARMEAIANKVGTSPEANNAGDGNKSRAKGCNPEKLERDINYATFLQ